MSTPPTLLATLATLTEFDEIIDVRTPAEFAEDHLPGARNAPVLNNEERVIIGTLYKQDPFAATRLGAAMVARNIASHLEQQFADRPPRWRPLVYCWRGGKRSGSLTTWFNLIGWRARQLEGGYKVYRSWVLETLQGLPAQYRYVVLHGPTGSGKTRLLQRIAAQGGQVLDLEQLAHHRGSVLGAWPGIGQPSQKRFDSLLLAQLQQFDRSRPVFVEAESKRVGQVHLPESLMQSLRTAHGVALCAGREARITYLCHDYRHLFDNPGLFKAQLDRLTMLHGHATISHWHQLIDAGAMVELFGELIDQHYDPAYRRSRPLSRQSERNDSLDIDPSADLSTAASQLLTRYGG